MQCLDYLCSPRPQCQHRCCWPWGLRVHKLNKCREVGGRHCVRRRHYHSSGTFLQTNTVYSIKPLRSDLINSGHPRCQGLVKDLEFPLFKRSPVPSWLTWGRNACHSNFTQMLCTHRSSLFFLNYAWDPHSNSLVGSPWLCSHLWHNLVPNPQLPLILARLRLAWTWSGHGWFIPTFLLFLFEDADLTTTPTSRCKLQI